MIAINGDAHANVTEEPRRLFLELLPRIESYLLKSFRHLKNEALEEALAEATANCFVAFMRLCQRGRTRQADARSLAYYAVRHFNSGRKVGGRLNTHDPLSRYAKLRKGITVERLDRYTSESREWPVPIIEEGRASILDQVAMRIDVPAWLLCLS